MYRKDNIKASVLALSCACLFQASDAMNGTVPNGYNSNTVNSQGPGMKPALAELQQNNIQSRGSKRHRVRNNDPSHVKMDLATSKIVRAAGAPAENNVAEPNRSPNPSARNRSVSPTPAAAANPLSVSPEPIPEPTRPDTFAEIEAAKEDMKTTLDCFLATASPFCDSLFGVSTASDPDAKLFYHMVTRFHEFVEHYKTLLAKDMPLSSELIIGYQIKLASLDRQINAIEDNDELSEEQQANLVKPLEDQKAALIKEMTPKPTVGKIRELRANLLREMSGYLSGVCDQKLGQMVLDPSLLSKMLGRSCVSKGGSAVIDYMEALAEKLKALAGTDNPQVVENAQKIIESTAKKREEIKKIDQRSGWKQAGALLSYGAATFFTAIHSCENIGTEEQAEGRKQKIAQTIADWLHIGAEAVAPNSAASRVSAGVARIIYELPVLGLGVAAAGFIGPFTGVIVVGTVLSSETLGKYFVNLGKKLDPIH